MAPPNARSSEHASERLDFIALVREQDRSMRMLAYRLLGDGHAVDDVLQDAYLKAYEAIPSFRNRSSASTWLYRITYNTCLDYLRKRQRDGSRNSLHSIDDLAEMGLEPGTGGDTAEEIAARGELAEALELLPVPQRAAVILVDALGYDYAATAQILGLRPGTVASRLHAARATLRTALGSRIKEDAR